MARYNYDCWVGTSAEQIPSLISQRLKECELEVIYQGNDYVKARDFPGKVPLSSFIIVDVLIEYSRQKQGKILVTVVAQNNDIPGTLGDRCWPKFQQIQQALWNL
ncbi:hypothetical protein VB715_02090 [Crocosphaera sp. UHCC 0190]|uniref:hypothetical protein n=1 Tax=Crocosphaera sp. UHCC 0190 TaxID=3110246 RepID=UPI002B206824|nr:hypothetical protein [Crocosphaera sp. UHCC 0190]MEA5508546.1 hypothetical protein [Crocosphaera sp. UHCC 0190]